MVHVCYSTVQTESTIETFASSNAIVKGMLHTITAVILFLKDSLRRKEDFETTHH